MPDDKTQEEGKLQDIVYIGDRKVEFYRYDNTLYIVDPEGYSGATYFTIDDLPTTESVPELPTNKGSDMVSFIEPQQDSIP